MMEDTSVLLHQLVNSSTSNRLFQDRLGMPQGRTYGPILGLLLANLISRAVSAKYASYFPFALSYDPSPWLAYNKPDHDDHHQQYYPEWYPIQNPYESSQYPTLTTGMPHEYAEKGPLVEEYNYSPAEDQSHANPTTVEKPDVDQEQSGSNVNIRRRPTAKPHRRRAKPTRKRNKYGSQKRRRTTTPEPEYYDSYEDYEEDKRKRPLYADSYEDDNDDYDYEPKPTKYKKQKRRPVRIKNKRREQLTTVDYSYDDYPVEVPQTEIVIVRQQQRQQTTTTTEPTTIITNGTTTEMSATTATSTTTTVNSTTTTTANSTSYGYGPSNGNEGISITYGPPQNRYQYSAPYVDWYTNDATRNAIVKRVHDIVEYDRELFQRNLK